MTVLPNEETPLLVNVQQQTEQTKEPTPLPWAQFSIVMFLQLAEPLTFQVIFVSSSICRTDQLGNFAEPFVALCTGGMFIQT